MNFRPIAAYIVVGILSASMSAAETIERFDSDGVKIRFITTGHGPAVVLLHGFSGSAEGAWINPGTVDALVLAGFRVTAMDHRGHGLSDKPHEPDSYGVEMAEDVRRLLDHLEVERAHIIGYSMGGKIANTFAARHPERLITLTLGGYGWPWRSSQVSLEQARENMARRTILPGNDLDALAAYSVRSNDLVPPEDALLANSIPTLSLVGTDDMAVPREDLEILRRTMSMIESIDMPGTHAGPDGALYKKQFSEEIIAFIASHAAR